MALSKIAKWLILFLCLQLIQIGNISAQSHKSAKSETSNSELRLKKITEQLDKAIERNLENYERKNKEAELENKLAEEEDTRRFIKEVKYKLDEYHKQDSINKLNDSLKKAELYNSYSNQQSNYFNKIGPIDYLVILIFFFWMWQLIHCIIKYPRNGNKFVWILFFLFMGIIAAPVYFSKVWRKRNVQELNHQKKMDIT